MEPEGGWPTYTGPDVVILRRTGKTTTTKSIDSHLIFIFLRISIPIFPSADACGWPFLRGWEYH